ncbi:MAG: ankyrin repeat domain-containing protein, partial [bacterium]|nr:ankyrin repeat domain-containing protein [bacterium]
MRITGTILLLLLLSACDMSPKQARRELIDRGYRYERGSFADCVARGDTTGLAMFLLAGMDVNVTTGGYSMLEHADGNPDMVARLLQAGADANGSGGVTTPLIRAVGKGSDRAVSLLLAAGAQPDLADGTGRTALMVAAESGDEAAVQLLLAAGAAANARSRLGTTALSLAHSAGHTAVVALLQQAGAVATDGPNLEALMDPKNLNKQAPERFEAAFETSAGPFRVEVVRSQAPQAADRFYNLVANGFFDDQRFFRVVRGRLVQFGLHGQPDVAARWYEATIPDDPVAGTHATGTLCFASGGANSRTTQIFINLVDNTDFDGAGLAPFGRVIDGLEI